MAVPHDQVIWRFIHVPRTGGTTIAEAWGLSNDEELARLHCHTPASMIPGNPFLFGFVRNPWDRAVSIWAYLTQEKVFSHSFTSWVLDQHCETGPWRGPQERKFCGSQVTFLDTPGIALFRFEDFELACDGLCGKIGPPANPVRILNGSKHDPWTEYYTPELFEQIRLIYIEDVQLWSTL